MTDGQTVLFKPTPNDGFRESVGREIRQKARSSHASNPDAPGATRHLRACEHLANYIDGLPLWDSRFRMLLKASTDSDRFELAGQGAFLVQILGLDVPAPPDIDAVFTEFAIACGADLKTDDASQATLAQVRSQHAAERTKDHERIRELEAEIDKLNSARSDDSQELSDLRGRLKALPEGKVEALSRRVAELEGEVDQANRRAAAAERRATKRAAKTKAAA